MSRFKPHDPDQMFLLPPSLAEWLPKDHVVYFVRDVVSVLDLSDIYRTYEGALGRPAYAPTMLVSVWIYGYLRGIRSSRRVERALYEDIGFRVLSGNQQPDHWTLNHFRTQHRNALAGFLKQTVLIADKNNLANIRRVAVDGSRIPANASKHSAMSYERMQEKEKQLQAEIEKYLNECDEQDKRDDDDFGSRRGDELPESLKEDVRRLEAIRKAKRELEEEAQERARAEQESRKKKAEEEGREFKPRSDPKEAKPDPKAQRNFTDPESRILVKNGKDIVQGYNAQLAVDTETQVIVAADLTNVGADAPFLVPMVEQAIANTGAVPAGVLADAGYFSEANIHALEDMLIEALIPPDRQKHSSWKNNTAPRGRMPTGLSAAARVRRKLNTKAGREKYKQRRCSVEPVFGQIKEARGLRRFLHRGLQKVRAMWLFECAVHNLAKLFKLQSAKLAAA